MGLDWLAYRGLAGPWGAGQSGDRATPANTETSIGDSQGTQK